MRLVTKPHAIRPPPSPRTIHRPASCAAVHSRRLRAPPRDAGFRTLGTMSDDEQDPAGGPPGHDRKPEDEFVRGEVRLTSHRRLTHGVYVLKREGLTCDEEYVRDLKAWRLVIPGSAVFTHVTAARLLGWQLPKLPEQTPVFVAMDLKDKRPRRAGIVCSRLVRKAEPFGAGELPVDWPEEILLRAARDLGTLDLVIMLDSARRLGHVDDKRMELVLASKRPGVRVLKAAWALSNKRAESGPRACSGFSTWRWTSRVQVQVDLFDESGAHSGPWPTCSSPGPTTSRSTTVPITAAKGQQRTDLRRDRGLIGSVYRRRGYVMDDLINHPLAAVMHELDRTQTRQAARHDPAGAVAAVGRQLPVLRAGPGARPQPVAPSDVPRPRLVEAAEARPDIPAVWDQSARTSPDLPDSRAGSADERRTRPSGA